jgi:hypothetical protein
MHVLLLAEWRDGKAAARCQSSGGHDRSAGLCTAQTIILASNHAYCLDFANLAWHDMLAGR